MSHNIRTLVGWQILALAAVLSNGSGLRAQEIDYGYDVDLNLDGNGYFYFNGAHSVYQALSNPTQHIRAKGLDIDKLLELRQTMLQSTIVGGIRGDATVNVDARAMVKIGKHHIGGLIQASISETGFIQVDPNDPSRNIEFFNLYNLPYIRAMLKASYTDKVTLRYHGEGAIPPIAFLGVDTKFRVDGVAQMSSDSYGLFGGVKADFEAGNHALGVHVSYWDDPLQQSVEAQYLYERHTLDSDFSFGVKAGMNLFGDLRVGAFLGYSLDTLAFEGIYFSDGSTPESHGFEVILTSGLPSPNLVPGDFDADGDVDGADFVAWQTHFPTASGATLATGDADGDGDVDGADFVAWQTNFPYAPSPAASPVPEPSTLYFVLAAIALLTCAPQFGKRLSNSPGLLRKMGE